eukprot:GFUD01008787.1.p1 GENE.GFUD01008787.1~~GFUD01008787.1.p1  ORF type:complete len:698 (+),score=171.78 GFUD01008787.1:65-2095(+)
MTEFFKKVKIKIDDVRSKSWAEPTALALKTTGQIVTALPPFPGRSILAGAFGLGSSVLNPDPSLADIKRSEASIKKEMKENFEEMASDMKKINVQLEGIDNGIDEVMKVVCDLHYNKGIDKISALHQFFLDGKGNLEKTCEQFNYQAAKFEVGYIQNFKSSKLTQYMKIILEREGQKALENFYQDVITTSAKYLQVMSIFLVWSGETERIQNIFERFNTSYETLTERYNGLLVIPEITQTMERRNSFVSKEKRPLADENTLKLINKMCQDLERKSFEGNLKGAEEVFNKIYENLGSFSFRREDHENQPRIYQAITYYHIVKKKTDEAETYARKSLEFLSSETSPALQIDTLRRAGVAFAGKNQQKKSRILIERALALSIVLYGEKSIEYSNCLMDYAVFLQRVDAVSERKATLEKALDIRATLLGKDNISVAQVLSQLAYVNYQIQRRSLENYDEGKKQAEEAINILSKLVNKNNINLVSPKTALAAMLQDQAISLTGRSREKMFKQVEELYLFCVNTCKDQLGEWNIETAKKYANLGRLYQEMGNNKQAEELLLKALKIQQTILGPEDEEVARCNNYLAVLYLVNLGQLDKAETHYVEAVRIRMKMFGPAHSQLQYDYDGLVYLYGKTGEREKQAEYEKKKEEWKKLQSGKKDTADTGEINHLSFVKEIIDYVVD